MLHAWLVCYRPLAVFSEHVLVCLHPLDFSIEPLVLRRHRRSARPRRYSPPLPKPAKTKKLNAMSPNPTNVSVTGSPFKIPLKSKPSTSYSG